MESVEFESKVSNGTITIIIPEEYARYIVGNVKVLVTPIKNDRIKKARKNGPGTLTPDDFKPCIDTKGWKFSREEANER